MKDGKNRLFEIMNKVTGMPLNENFDNNINDDELDWKSRLIKDLEKYNIHLDTNFGNEYFIKCNTNYDFNINFYSDGVKISEFNGNTNETIENVFKEYDDLLEYILSKQYLFKTNSNNIGDLR